MNGPSVAAKSGPSPFEAREGAGTSGWRSGRV